MGRASACVRAHSNATHARHCDWMCLCGAGGAGGAGGRVGGVGRRRQAVRRWFPSTHLRYWLTGPAVVEELVKKSVYHSGRPPLTFHNFDNHKVPCTLAPAECVDGGGVPVPVRVRVRLRMRVEWVAFTAPLCSWPCVLPLSLLPLLPLLPLPLLARRPRC